MSYLFYLDLDGLGSRNVHDETGLMEGHKYLKTPSKNMWFEIETPMGIQSFVAQISSDDETKSEFHFGSVDAYWSQACANHCQALQQQSVS